MKTLKPVTGWGALGLLLILVWLVVLFPAQLAYRFMPAAQLQQLPFTLTDMQGTLWHGRAIKPVIQATRYGSVNLDSVGWDLNPWSLLTLSPKLSYSAKGLGAQLKGKVHIEDQQVINLTSLTGRGEIQELAQALGAFLPPQLAMASTITGQYKLTVDQARLTQSSCEKLEGNLILRDVQLPLWPETVDLNAQLSCNKQGLSAEITDTGSLSLRARLKVSPNGRFKLVGSLAPSSPDQIALLKFTPLKKRNGRYEILIQG